MSESLPILTEMAERLFSDLASRREAPFEELWTPIEASGLPNLLLPEAQGGFGGDWQDAFAVVRLAGYHAVPVPIAEAILAGAVGWDQADGIAGVAQTLEGRLDGGKLTGRAIGVPWGRRAAAVFAQHDGELLRIDAGGAGVTERDNPAGDASDVIAFEAAAAEPVNGPDLMLAGALLRVAQMAGAMDGALTISVEHANGRTQFGRPIGKFQAVQQNLAVFAEEAAAVNCAGQAAARALDLGEADFEIASAKLRANRASAIGAAVAHQVHGAIGFTLESALHPLTRRLISWRAEFGGDRFWAECLGRQVCGFGADGFWPELVRRGDAA